MYAFVLLIIICFPWASGAITIGSDSSVLRLTVQQILGNGDVIAGFASIASGFGLLNSSVTAYYNSFFPVSGSIDLNGGTLVLLNDLVLTNTVEIKRLGNIVGNGKKIQFASGMSVIPSQLLAPNLFTLTDLKIVLANNISLIGTTLVFSGNNIIEGNNNRLVLSSGAIEVANNSVLTLRNIQLGGVSGQNVRCADSSGVIIFENVELALLTTYTFATGAFVVNEHCIFTGNDTNVVYTSSSASTIAKNSQLVVGDEVTFIYVPTGGAKDRIVLSDDTASFILDNAKLAVFSGGMQFTKGVFAARGKSLISSDAIVMAHGIQFGDGISAINNCKLLIEAGLDIEKGYVTIDNV